MVLRRVKSDRALTLEGGRGHDAVMEVDGNGLEVLDRDECLRRLPSVNFFEPGTVSGHLLHQDGAGRFVDDAHRRAAEHRSAQPTAAVGCHGDHRHLEPGGVADDGRGRPMVVDG